MGCRLLNPTPVFACCLGIHGPPNSVRPGGTSPYMPLVMMRDQALFQPYYQLESASAADTARWLDAFTWFLKKVTLRAGGHKPLLLKSPVHTARVPLLLKLFPRAKFIYIHRDPYTVRGPRVWGWLAAPVHGESAVPRQGPAVARTGTQRRLDPPISHGPPVSGTCAHTPHPNQTPQVFSSAAHMADSYYPYTALQRMTPPDVTRFILDQFSLLHDAYQAAKPLIPPGTTHDGHGNSAGAQP